MANLTNKDGSPKRWLSPPPTDCDLCQQAIETAFIDGKTKMGPWGCMCPSCHTLHGYGLGVGRGQRYEKQTHEGKVIWAKTGG